MPQLEAFHDVRFPTDIALGSIGGPQRQTEIVTLGSGHEQRNARWACSRRRFNAGYGVKSLDDLARVIGFFEARRGRLFGFRFRDPVDHKSSLPGAEPSALDQMIGTGDGSTATFGLVKTYGEQDWAWQRRITKPVMGSIVLDVAGQTKIETTHFTVDHLSGEITFLPDHIPAAGVAIHAGFEFDVPVRFDSDEISLNMSSFRAGDIANIPLIEILD